MFLQRYSDYENAEKYLLKAVTFDASSDEICIGKMIARYLLGLLHSLLKNTKKARECFEKIIAEPSEHMLVRDLQTEAKKTMEQFGLANKYLVMLDQIRGFLRKIIN